MIRIGHGYDVHKLVEGRKLILGGVEIENNGIENFVKKFTPEGTRVRNYGSEESNEKKDLSEYTSGLDSTSNRKSSEDNIGADANTSIKDSSQNNNSDKDNGSSNDEKGGPGFFAP